tara:strand:+ start:8332 stop:8847 length:516 start_codon:yes stop_codon:yes gene_type:complete
MSGTAFPSTVSQVDTTARFPLGYEVTLPATKSSTLSVENDTGPQKWVYILADEELLAGDIVQVNPDWASPFHGHKSDGGNTRNQIIGVAQHTIASGSYGFIQCGGYATYIQGDGDVAAGESIMCHATTDGMADTWAAGAGAEEKILGTAFTADAADTAVGSRVVFAGMLKL